MKAILLAPGETGLGGGVEATLGSSTVPTSPGPVAGVSPPAPQAAATRVTKAKNAPDNNLAPAGRPGHERRGCEEALD